MKKKLNPIKSANTTGLGVAAIVTAIGAALTAYFDADAATNVDWGQLVPAIIAGFGLIFAKDGDKRSEDVE